MSDHKGKMQIKIFNKFNYKAIYQVLFSLIKLFNTVSHIDNKFSTCISKVKPEIQLKKYFVVNLQYIRDDHPWKCRRLAAIIPSRDS